MLSTKLHVGKQKTSSKANDWLALTKGMARVHQRNTPNEGICTKISAKEAQSLPNDWIATLAIRVLYSHPTANDQDPMIRRNEGLRSSGAFKLSKLN
ncbi:hypothetical protein Tco_1380805 [Tanacetum coccineum]